jgi:hypothetical protein
MRTLIAAIVARPETLIADTWRLDENTTDRPCSKGSPSVKGRSLLTPAVNKGGPEPTLGSYLSFRLACSLPQGPRPEAVDWQHAECGPNIATTIATRYASTRTTQPYDRRREEVRQSQLVPRKRRAGAAATMYEN